MNSGQRKLLEFWGVLGGLLILGWLLQDNVWVTRLAFIPVLGYIIWNWRAVRAIERVGPTPKEIIESNILARTWIIVLILIEIVLAFFFLLSGRNLGDYIDGYWLFFIALMAPIALPLLLSQMALFKRLDHAES